MSKSAWWSWRIISTGRSLQFYLNPERDVPIEFQRVHGLSGEFLADKPLFAHVADEFLEFVGDAVLVIYNASFDSNSSMPN